MCGSSCIAVSYTPPQDGGSIGYADLGSVVEKWGFRQRLGQHIRKLVLCVNVKDTEKAG